MRLLTSLSSGEKFFQIIFHGAWHRNKTITRIQKIFSCASSPILFSWGITLSRIEVTVCVFIFSCNLAIVPNDGPWMATRIYRGEYQVFFFLISFQPTSSWMDCTELILLKIFNPEEASYRKLSLAGKRNEGYWIVNVLKLKRHVLGLQSSANLSWRLPTLAKRISRTDENDLRHESVQIKEKVGTKLKYNTYRLTITLWQKDFPFWFTTAL